MKGKGEGKRKGSHTSRPATEYQAEISQSPITEAVWNRLCCSSNVGSVSATDTLSLPFPEDEKPAAADGPATVAKSWTRSGAGLTRSCLFWPIVSLFRGGILELKLAKCVAMQQRFLYGQYEVMARCWRVLDSYVAAGLLANEISSPLFHRQ